MGFKNDFRFCLKDTTRIRLGQKNWFKKNKIDKGNISRIA